MDANKLFGNLFIGLGLIAFVVYLSLNISKLSTAYGNARLLMSGKPADELILESPQGARVKVLLPSTDLFQRISHRQISFYRMDADTRSGLFGSTGKVTYQLNGKPVAIQPVTQDDNILLPMTDRLLYIIPEPGLRNLAEITRTHRNEPVGIMKCLGALCAGLSLEVAGVGALEGPYSPVDQIPMRRGLPLGQWITKPELTIVLTSNQPALAGLRLTVLAPFEGIRPSIQGPVRQARVVAGNREPEHHEYPLRRFSVEMVTQLSKGQNQVKVSFDKFRKTERSGSDVEQVRAGYLAGVTVVELSVAKP